VAEIMASSDNTLIFLSSKSFEGDNMEKERWYSVPWMKEKYTTERIEAMKNASAPDNGLKLDLPPANTLLPKNFDILPADAEKSQKPVRIVETDLVDLWYKKDDTFKLPKAYIAAKIYTGDCGFGATARGRVFADCWEKVVTEYVREYAYMGDCAQLRFNI
jgi:secreted Zn-dependent insulinase-like peptidase